MPRQRLNGVGTDPANTKLRLSRAVELDATVRRIKSEAARKRDIALRAKFGAILSKARLNQLASLTKGNKWKRIPGVALDIGGGANGSVWHIDVNQHIYSWAGRNWRKTNGAAKRIDADPQGRPWVVNKSNLIFRRNGRGWDKLPGKAHDIGVGADGTAWVIGTNKEAGGYGIYRWNGANWDKIPGSAVKIDVDPKGNAWVVNKFGHIYRWNPLKNNWERIPGIALDIGIGADGTVMHIDTNRFSYVWDGKKWNKLAGTNAENITVDRNGNPWVITKAKNIWAWDTAGKAPPAKITSRPWKPYGGGYGAPVISKEGDIVTVTGMVKGGDYGLVWTLPRGSRPLKRLVFNINNHDQAGAHGRAARRPHHLGHRRQGPRLAQPRGHHILD